MDALQESFYDRQFVKNLFNEMSKTYGSMNYVTSFGFSERWRKQCISRIKIRQGAVVYDFMTGMGECWTYILKEIGENGKLVAVDFSDEMIRYAENKKNKLNKNNVFILKEDILSNNIPDASADYIISGFGLKTFSTEQLEVLAGEVKRILKPGGEFSLVEISTPENSFLKPVYKFYLKYIIPSLGRIFLGNSDNYRMLGIYTERFHNCHHVKSAFENVGLNVTYHPFFYSCATGISGKN